MGSFFGIEFKPENRRYMFWITRILGKRVQKNIYMWRGRMWVVGEVLEDT